MKDPLLKSTDLITPHVSWPTLALLAGLMTVWAAAVYAGSTGLMPAPAAILLTTWMAYAAFTPMHDAAHGSVSRVSWLNETVGHLSSIILNGPFHAFRFVHLAHHRFTNEPGKDPDLWSGTGPALLLPLRWATQELHYYYLYVKHWTQRPENERLGFLVSFGLQGVILAWLAASGWGKEALLYWVLPAKIAVMLLAFCNDYLPHQPHAITAKEDRYRATHILTSPLLDFLFLNQNMHLIHHLYPGVPFHRYGRIWRAKKDFLLARGTREIKGIQAVGRVMVEAVV